MEGLKQENIPYTGFIFFGLMKTGEDPFMIEYNCRLGDPETESVVPRIKNDLICLLESVAEKRLKGETIEIDPDAVATIMLVSAGYPGQYAKGIPVTGENDIADSLVFHAGTKPMDAAGSCCTDGGRVLAVSSKAPSLQKALEKSLQNSRKINFTGKYFRRDIGFDLSIEY